jgi:hypothetical protein
LKKEAAGASRGLENMSQTTITQTASSKTDCKDQPLLFQELGPRKVVADFSAVMSPATVALYWTFTLFGLAASRF